MARTLTGRLSACICFKEVDEVGAEMISTEIKRQAGAWLFCKLCHKDGKGFNVFDPELGKKRIAVGWGNRTVQKCRLNTTGIDPSRPEKPEKPKVKKAKGDERVIDVEAEEEKEREPKSSTGASSSAKPNIFATPEGKAIPNPNWGEERPRAEEKKMPKKTKESKDKEKKEKKEQKDKKHKRKREKGREPGKGLFRKGCGGHVMRLKNPEGEKLPERKERCDESEVCTECFTMKEQVKTVRPSAKQKLFKRDELRRQHAIKVSQEGLVRDPEGESRIAETFNATGYVLYDEWHYERRETLKRLYFWEPISLLVQRQQSPSNGRFHYNPNREYLPRRKRSESAV